MVNGGGVMRLRDDTTLLWLAVVTTLSGILSVIFSFLV
jgi:hypothetical protein